VWLLGKETGTDATSFPPDFCDPLTPTEKLTPCGGTCGYGGAIASSGSVRVVAGGNRAYVYEHDGASWVEVAQLTESVITDPDDPGEGDYGASVAVSGNIIVVGNPKDDDCAGIIGDAYVYKKVDGSWVETGFLTGDFGSESENESYPYCYLLDFFGYQVSISGGTIAVGTGYEDASAAFLFEKVNGTWEQAALLTESDFPSYGINFQSVLLYNGAILFSAVASDGVKSVYMFEMKPDGSWDEVAKLSPSDGAPGESFGSSFAVDGGVIIIGSPPGSAYVFEEFGGAWVETQKLASLTDGFGSSVSVSGNVIVIGTISSGDFSSIGQAHVYQKQSGSWVETAVLTGNGDNTSGLGDRFSTSVSVSEIDIAVGAERDKPAHAAYFFPICEYVMAHPKMHLSHPQSSHNYNFYILLQVPLNSLERRCCAVLDVSEKALDGLIRS